MYRGWISERELLPAAEEMGFVAVEVLALWVKGGGARERDKGFHLPLELDASRPPSAGIRVNCSRLPRKWDSSLLRSCLIDTFIRIPSTLMRRGKYIYT